MEQLNMRSIKTLLLSGLILLHQLVFVEGACVDGDNYDIVIVGTGLSG
jgi:hypothetical protein